MKFSKAKPAADGKPQIDIAVTAFGSKSHISIDRRHGIIRRARVTDAAAHGQCPNGWCRRARAEPFGVAQRAAWLAATALLRGLRLFKD